MGEKSEAILIIVILIVMVTVAFLISFSYLNKSAMTLTGKITTSITASTNSGHIEFKENIDTPNEEIIEKSSEANNFLKRCIGIALILFVFFLFYRVWRKER